VTEVPAITGFGLAPTAVCDGSSTRRLVVPVDAVKLVSPEYAPEIVSVPTGAAAEELHEPLPFVNVATHSDVEPVVKVTVPVGVGSPETLVVTVVEYVTEAPSVTEETLAWTEVCDGALLTTSGVVPVEPTNTVSPPYVPVIVSVPTGAAVELQEALPPDNGAVQSGVDPLVKVTDPVGVGTPVALVVTVAE
jgi:hypothetical protein